MLDGLLEDVSEQAHRRVRFLLEHYEGERKGLPDLKAECLAECWLALQSGKAAADVPKAVSNLVRLKSRWLKTPPGGTHHYSPLDNIERQLDATAYMDVLRRELRPDEFALLQARELHDKSFDELTLQSLSAKGIEPTEPALQRESARIRKQLHRLRVRCAAAITAAYPDAAEDIGCWS